MRHAIFLSSCMHNDMPVCSCGLYHAHSVDQKVDVIVGLESRGYYFGLPLAQRLKLPFVPLRKAGKLPGTT